MDIPFECLPLGLVAQLAVLDKSSALRAQQEFTTRDVGTELYKYFANIPVTPRMNMINKMQSTLLWKIIRAVHASCTPPTEHWNIMLIPTHHPLRVNTHTVCLHEQLEYMMHTATTLDITHLVPTLLQGTDVVSFSIEDAVTKLARALDTVVWDLTWKHLSPNEVAVDWVSTPTTWYMINLCGNHIYCMSQISLSKHKEPELDTESLLAYMQYCDSHTQNVVNILLDANLYV